MPNKTITSVWCQGHLWFLTRKPSSNLEATALMITDSPSGPYTEDGRSMTPTEVMESREYLSRELRYSYHVVNLTACIADGIDPHRDWCGQSTMFEDIEKYLTEQE